MEDSINATGENKVPFILSVAAFIAALLALVLAIKVKSDSKKTTEGLADVATKVTEVQAGVESVRNNSAKAADVADVAAKLSDFQGKVETNFNALAGSVNKQNEVIKGLVAKPSRTTTPGHTAPTETAGPGEYIVKPGDTGAKIARANHVSIKALESANTGVNFKKLHSGQKIKLPAAPTTTGAATAPAVGK